ncbi:MAG: protein kinase [Deltaproteobacteria bacterium]|nr:protein kinase [Deltaproteobacteria bacterium]
MRSCSVCRRFNPGAGPHCPRDGATTHDGPAPELAQGSRVFGRFEIGEPVARGGTGTLYRAREQGQGPIALKVLHAELTQNPVDRSRIKRELTKATSVAHPRIAHVREVGETEGRIFLVRDFIEGDSLASVLFRFGPLDLARAARIAHAVASALVEAHKIGVLHRDLNPRHVIVLPDGLPMLLDLSLAAPIPGGIAGKPAAGSVPYLSPEQAAGKLVTLRADLYAVGLLLYEMLTGSGPSADGDVATLVAARAEAEAPPAPQGAPDEIAALLAQLLARDPKDRPFGARQVEKVLSRFATEALPRATTEPIKPAPISRAGSITEATAPFPTLPVAPRTPLPPARVSLATPDPGAATLRTRGRVDATEVDRTAPGLPPSLEEELDEALAVAAKGDRRDAAAAMGAAHAAIGGERAAPRHPQRAQATGARPAAPGTRGPAGRPKSGRDRPRVADARPEEPPEEEAGVVEPSVPRSGRAAQKTLVGLALPAEPDAPGEHRQAWARSLLGLPQEKTPPPPRPDTVPIGAEALFSPEDTAPTAVPVTGFPSVEEVGAPPPGESTHTFQPLPSDDEAEEISVRDMEHVTAPTRPSTAVLEAAARALAEPLVPIEPAAPSQPDLDGLAPSGSGLASPADLRWASSESELVALPATSRQRRRLVVGVAAGVAAALAGVGVWVALSGRDGAPAVPAAGEGAPTTTGAAAPMPAVEAPPAVPVPTPVPTPTAPAAADPVVAGDGAAAPAVAPPAAADGGAAAPPGADVAPVPAEPVDPSAPAQAAPPPPAADSDPRTSEQIIKSGRASIRRRRWADAGRAFETVLGRDRENLDATLGLAQVQMESRRYEEAIASFRRAVELRPTSATFKLYLGNALSAAGHPDEARAVWRQVLEMDPRNLEARQRLGLLRRPPPRAPPRPQSTRPAPAKTPAKTPARPSRRNVPRNPF